MTFGPILPVEPDWAWLADQPSYAPLFFIAANPQHLRTHRGADLACMVVDVCAEDRGGHFESDVAWEYLRALGLPAICPALVDRAAGVVEPRPWVYLGRCDYVLVPQLDGWDVSCHVWETVRLALRAHKPVYLLGPNAPKAVA